MKKRLLTTMLFVTLAVSAVTGCGAAGKDDRITVVSREDGSGTRGAFVELTGVEENGEDLTTTEAIITNSTEVMMTTVAGDAQAIGYASMGSMNDSVKALAVDGVAATAENIKNGSYALARPFYIATKETISAVAQDFISFIQSAEGIRIVEAQGCIAVEDSADPFESSRAAGKIVVAGSSSVTPLMEKLMEAYLEINPDASIELQESDSTTGMLQAAEGTCDIGMASRELKDSELAEGLIPTVIAQDGICVIVNQSNSVEELRLSDIAAIFRGERTQW